VSCNNTSGCSNIEVYVAYDNENKNWYNRSFQYRQNMTLTANSASAFNYTFPIKLDSTNIGNKFNWQNECNDIRFADQNGNKMSYWIETCNFANKEALIWAKTNTILTSNMQYNFSMYYGNKSVSTTSNGIDTFLYFEDFENFNSQADGILPIGWNSYGSGEVQLYTQANNNRAIVKTTNDDPNGGFVDIGTSITDYEMRIKTN
jgi:hypothetical protein